ncbi:hypothetical protein EW146_g1422 [Bondarzewia mesenterica]|uniref:Protein kinase domain-containing protein n=1 Tax=Bondarzewia mesenterica TaxID=1095465 RepID=A0A4S4M5Q5_9AGAM|nr:hypothetical protein EW146_g1422 [Bondarzewia mesenterica]
MAHSFVVARFLPQLSAQWTSHYGFKKAADLVTRPFLALRVYATDIGLGDPSQPTRYAVLFVVSSQKPIGVNKDCFFALGSAVDQKYRALTVNPPISLGGRALYVHTFPKLHACFQGDVDITSSSYSPYRLDESNFHTFCHSVMEDHHNRKKLTHCPSSGGDEPVENGWDTWSGSTTTGMEYLRKPVSCVYELLEYEDPSLLDPPAIYEELLMYKQLAADYSWSGVTKAISWVKESRASTTGCEIKISPCLLTGDGEISRSSNEAFTLHSMRIPFSGDTPAADAPEEPETMGWDDEPEPDFEDVPEPRPAVPAADIKVIAFDLLGTIFDREGAIKEAMLSLAPSEYETRTSRQLLEIYVECEALKSHECPDASYVDIARAAFIDAGRHLGISSMDEVALEKALEMLLRPRLYDDAIQALKDLRVQGYALLGIPSLDLATFAQFIKPYVPPEIIIDMPCSTVASLHCQNHSVFPALLERSQSVHPRIRRAQILVVTSSPFRIIEPACSAGFPTALLRRTDNLESKVSMDTAVPALTTDTLLGLSSELGDPLLSHPAVSAEARADGSFSPFRVRSHYQVTEILGSGSFGNVLGAFHVLTGEEVAIKYEMPKDDKPDEVCVLPYEIQVYRQLRGYQAIPSVRWSGMFGGAYFLILDKLGATLEQIRRVCRGQISMKTVSILAVQMVSHPYWLTRIEFVHSRGIILRDIKPENFAMGIGRRSNFLYLFDFGLARLFVDPVTGEHIPYRSGLVGLGTARYASYNVHFGREHARRDDVEALGNILLFLLHGRLPWQGIYAPNIPAKMLRIGEMKQGKPFFDLLARSPPEFTTYFDHCRGLSFEEKPDYTLLRQIFKKKMKTEGWNDNEKYDWENAKDLEKGTLVPEEYKLDPRFVDGDLDW